MKLSTCLLLFIQVFIISDSQLIKKVSNCFDSCLACQTYQPSHCIINSEQKVCQNGFNYNQSTKKCQIIQSLQSTYSSFQLIQQYKVSNSSSLLTNWKQGKIIECSYINQKGSQQYFNTIGMFKQVFSISKQFEVSYHHEVYYFSFNLVRNSWMPHNDFLIVDIEAGTELLGSYQISYDNRQGFTDSNLIVCNEQPVITQKFNIKINYKQFKTQKIKITFTGFLFTATWGITNIKFIPACQKFTVYNKLTQTCDFCDLGYFSQIYNQNAVSKCTKCSFQCLQCLDYLHCTSCIKGYRLTVNNFCIQNDYFSGIVIKEFSNSQYKTCRIMNQSFYQNSQKNVMQSLQYRNPQNKNFGNTTLTFEFIYNTKFKENNGKVDINVNDKAIDIINYLNLTNKGFSACSNQSSERYSIIKMSILISNVPQNIKISFKGNECKDCKFGIQNLNVFYVQSNSIDQSIIQNLNLFNSEKQAQLSNSQQINYDSTLKAIVQLKPIVASNSQKISIKKGINDNIDNQKPQIVNDKVSQNKDSVNEMGNHQSLFTVNQIKKSSQIKIKLKNQYEQESILPQMNKNETRSINSPQTTSIAELHQNNTHINSNEKVIQQPQNKAQSTYIKDIQNQKQNSKIQDQKYQNNNTKLINKTQVDHLAFSKYGNNGLTIRLNKKNSAVPKNGESLLMQITSNSAKLQEEQSKKEILQTKLYQSIAINKENLYISAYKELSKEEYEKQHIYQFLTDQTYLDNKVTLYSISNELVKTKLIEFDIERTDFLNIDQMKVLQAFQNLFSTFAWMILITGIIGLFLGKLYFLEQGITSIQYLFLGVYVFTSYLPASIGNTLSGLRRLQNYDIFAISHLQRLEDWLLGDLIQQGSLRFTLFHKDINFTRNVIPIIFLLILLTIWIALLYFIYKRQIQSQSQNQQNENQIQINNLTNTPFSNASITLQHFFTKHVVFDIFFNKINFLIQIIKFFFLPITFISFKQFNNFSYPEGSTVGEIFNLLFCFLCFIIIVASAILITVYCSNQYFKLQYEKYIQSFTSLYFKKITKNYLPTQHHRLIHPLLRFLKIFIFTLLVAFLGNYPLPVSVFMILFHAADLFYSWFNSVYQDSLHFKFYISQCIMLSVIAVIQLILSQISGIISTNGYLGFGYIYMSIAIVVILNTFARSGYLIIDYIQKLNKDLGKGRRMSLRSERIV